MSLHIGCWSGFNVPLMQILFMQSSLHRPGRPVLWISFTFLHSFVVSRTYSTTCKMYRFMFENIHKKRLPLSLHFGEVAQMLPLLAYYLWLQRPPPLPHKSYGPLYRPCCVFFNSIAFVSCSYQQNRALLSGMFLCQPTNQPTNSSWLHLCCGSTVYICSTP